VLTVTVEVAAAPGLTVAGVEAASENMDCATVTEALPVFAT
jgi:hypothetical protein